MFEVLRTYNMKLNPNKCVFGVFSGKFLSVMVNQQNIKDNLNKIKAILDMEALQTVREVQQLTGRITVLNHFVSKATDKCLPFF